MNAWRIMDMKRCLPTILCAALCFGAACSSVTYEGETLDALPSDAQVFYYMNRNKGEKPPVGSVALGIAEYTASPNENSAAIRRTLSRAARERGANAVVILRMDKIPAGEARSDQIYNQTAPGWVITDNSDTALTYMKDSIDYAYGKDAEKPLFKTKVKAEFYSVPEHLLPPSPTAGLSSRP